MTDGPIPYPFAWQSTVASYSSRAHQGTQGNPADLSHVPQPRFGREALSRTILSPSVLGAMESVTNGLQAQPPVEQPLEESQSSSGVSEHVGEGLLKEAGSVYGARSTEGACTLALLAIFCFMITTLSEYSVITHRQFPMCLTNASTECNTVISPPIPLYTRTIVSLLSPYTPLILEYVNILSKSFGSSAFPISITDHVTHRSCYG